MKIYILSLCLLSSSIFSEAQNVGIGTTTPGSRLTVNGSMAGGYTSVTSNTYTILDNDYYINWNGTAPGTFNLPLTVATNKGRIYKIKNNTSLYQLIITQTDGVLIDGATSLALLPGNSAEIIANGNSINTTWEVVGLTSSTNNSGTIGESAGVLGSSLGSCNPSPLPSGNFYATLPAASQSLTVTVNVTIAGRYTIASNNVNGLTFFGSGIFSSPGVQTANIYAQGIPINSGTYNYTLSYGNSSCNAGIVINSAYTFNCGGVTQTQNPFGALLTATSYTGSFTIPYVNGNGQNYPATVQTVGGLTLTRTAGTYALSGGTVVYTLSGTYNGFGSIASFTIPECTSPVIFGDAIRSALAQGGCFACSAYDAASPDTWVEMSSSEYTKLQNLLGSGVYGAAASVMSTTSTTAWLSNYTVTQNYTNETSLPTSNYPFAMSIRTGNGGPPNTMAGIRLKVSFTAQNSGFADLSPTSYTPNVSTILSNTIYYFVIKRPSALTASGAPSNMALYTTFYNQLGAVSLGTGSCYYGLGNVTAPSSTNGGTQCFQVLSTPTKQW